MRRCGFHTRIDHVMRRSIATVLQLLGLIVTAESMVLYFGDMGPMMMTATLGAGLFYAGYFHPSPERSIGPANMSRYTTSYSSIGYPHWTRAVKILDHCVLRSRFSFRSSSVRCSPTKFGLTPWDVTQQGIYLAAGHLYLPARHRKHPAHPFQYARACGCSARSWNRYGARGSSPDFSSSVALAPGS